MVGRYLKCLKYSNYSPLVKIGSYLRINEEEIDYFWFDFPNNHGCFSRNRITDGEFELMPEGFIPESEQSNLINNLVI